MTESDAPSLPVFGFRCRTCGEWHSDLPAFEVPAPMNLLAIPEPERDQRCILETDACVVDGSEFYVRALLQLPIIGFDRSFVWMVWVSLSKANFARFVDTFEKRKRSRVGPFFGWLDSSLPFYAETRSLKTMVHLRDDFQRPLVELEPTEHPLAVEQRDGMSVERAAEIVAGLERDYPVPSRRAARRRGRRGLCGSASYTTVPCRS